MKTFYYKPSSELNNNLFTILIALFLILGPIIYPFGLRIGRLHLLGPLPTAIACFTVGASLLFWVFKSVRKSRKMSAGNITVNNDIVTYPAEKGSAPKAFNTTEITEVSADEGFLTVTLSDGTKIVFDLERFESLAHAKEFLALIQK